MIVACRNEEKFIARCLDSIIANDYPHSETEILVVDGMSTDGTKNIVGAYTQKYPFIKLIDNKMRNTPCAFNIGIKRSRGELIMIMGAHSEYCRNYISSCVEAIGKYGADNVGGIWKIRTVKNTIINKAIVLSLASFFGAGNAYYRRGCSKGVMPVDTVFGGCYRREVFDKVGLFNEKLLRTQDMEFNIRLRKNGGKIFLIPEVESNYYPKPDLKSFFSYNFKCGDWVFNALRFTKNPLKMRHYISFIAAISGISLLVASLFFHKIIWIFLLAVSAYILMAIFFSVKIAIIEKDFRLIAVLPVVFFVRHFAYGVGSVFGAFKLIGLKIFGRIQK